MTVGLREFKGVLKEYVRPDGNVLMKNSTIDGNKKIPACH